MVLKYTSLGGDSQVTSALGLIMTTQTHLINTMSLKNGPPDLDPQKVSVAIEVPEERTAESVKEVHQDHPDGTTILRAGTEVHPEELIKGEVGEDSLMNFKKAAFNHALLLLAVSSFFVSLF